METAVATATENGDGSVGDRVFVRDGKVIGDAPTLPSVEIEI